VVAVDTNILVRLLTHDDEDQFKTVFVLFRHEDIFIPDTVWVETEWVLRFAYKFNAHEINQSFRKLLALQNVRTSDAKRILQVLEWHEAGLDFADAFHLSVSIGADSFQTFDRAFIKKAEGLGGCLVKHPE